jgi:hypothetical protein
MRRWAVPLAIAYAAYVIVNLSLYTMRNGGGSKQPGAVFMLGYTAIAIGVSVISALLLYRRRTELV